MIELNRHIEILLLSNDCVIVPGLGGFMTHHADAWYDDGSRQFLPPLRTLGFNPQLKINDSLLALSYVEAYDISYPEALRRIEDEVNELRQHLETEGYYELNDIGTLSLNEDGNCVFTPCEAGILTPSLYALDAFEIERLQETVVPKPIEIPVAAEEEAKEPVAPKQEEVAEVIEINSAPVEEVEEEEEEKFVKIKFSWIRNTAAIAAVFLAIFLIAIPSGERERMTRTISNFPNTLFFGMMSKDTNTNVIDIKKSDVTSHVKEIKSNVTEITSHVMDTTSHVTPTPSQPLASAEGDGEPTGYCIVLASCVSQKNADAFVADLREKGYENVRVYIRNKITRVVYGRFDTQNEAYNELRKIHRNRRLEEAWVYKFN